MLVPTVRGSVRTARPHARTKRPHARTSRPFDVTAGWERLTASPVEVVAVPGHHLNLLG